MRKFGEDRIIADEKKASQRSRQGNFYIKLNKDKVFTDENGKVTKTIVYGKSVPKQQSRKVLGEFYAYSGNSYKSTMIPVKVEAENPGYYIG